MSSVPPTDAVTLSADHTAYTPSSTINVTLINHRSTSIFTFDHQTSCTILTLQRQTTNGWVATGGCALGRMTQRVEIKAGATMQIALAPGAGQIHATPWPAGTYRVILNYALQSQKHVSDNPSYLCDVCYRINRLRRRLYPGSIAVRRLALHPAILRRSARRVQSRCGRAWARQLMTAIQQRQRWR